MTPAEAPARRAGAAETKDRSTNNPGKPRFSAFERYEYPAIAEE